jgi:type VI secretion system protein VasG
VVLRTLDLGLFQAGASMKGEFENRLRQVIEEVQASPKPIILFIDEAHTLIGAGGAPARETPRTCSSRRSPAARCAPSRPPPGPNTRKYIEKDPALTRRFQVIKVEEPSEDKAVLMIAGFRPCSKSITASQFSTRRSKPPPSLSHRYIPSRQLAGQSREPHRYRMRPRGHQPARHAAGSRGLPAQIEQEKAHLEGLDAHWKQEKEAGKQNPRVAQTPRPANGKRR